MKCHKHVISPCSNCSNIKGRCCGRQLSCQGRERPRKYLRHDPLRHLQWLLQEWGPRRLSKSSLDSDTKAFWTAPSHPLTPSLLWKLWKCEATFLRASIAGWRQLLVRFDPFPIHIDIKQKPTGVFSRSQNDHWTVAQSYFDASACLGMRIKALAGGFDATQRPSFR